MGNLVSFSTQCLPLGQLKEMLASKVFIETGCFRGWSLGYALGIGFDKCYSCDIDQEMIDFCNNNLEKYKDKFQIVQADSCTFLTDLLPQLDDIDSIIFYLDAHLPGWDKGGEREITVTKFTFPLEQELEIINRFRPNRNDLIIVDDLRLYEDGDFESGNWDQRARFGLSLDFISRFGYSISRFYQQEGYFVLTK